MTGFRREAAHLEFTGRDPRPLKVHVGNLMVGSGAERRAETQRDGGEDTRKKQNREL